MSSATTELVERAERAGTFVGLEVGVEELVTFYQEHDEGMVGEAQNIAAKYANTTAKLVRMLRKKYGGAPATREKVLQPAQLDPGAKAGAGGDGEGGSRAMLASSSIEDLREELRRRELEQAAETCASLEPTHPPTTLDSPANLVILVSMRAVGRCHGQAPARHRSHRSYPLTRTHPHSRTRIPCRPPLLADRRAPGQRDCRLRSTRHALASDLS